MGHRWGLLVIVNFWWTRFKPCRRRSGRRDIRRKEKKHTHPVASSNSQFNFAKYICTSSRDAREAPEEKYEIRKRVLRADYARTI